MERYCGGHLCYGPPIDEGFYYDMFLKEKTINQEDFPKLEELVKCAVKVRLNVYVSLCSYRISKTLNAWRSARKIY